MSPGHGDAPDPKAEGSTESTAAAKQQHDQFDSSTTDYRRAVEDFLLTGRRLGLVIDDVVRDQLGNAPVSRDMTDALLAERVRRSARRKVDEEESARDKVGLDPLWPSELADLGRAEPLVGDLIYSRTLAQLAGPAGSYKSFVALAIAAALATGTDLDHHRVPERGRVVYAAEGAFGLHARLHAWCEVYGVDFDDLDEWLYFLPQPVQLGRAGDVDAMVDLVKALNPALVIFDTRAKCTVGLKENDATEQGVAIAGVERVMDAARCAALVIHHTGKDASAGGRGSTAWDGGVWSDLRMSGGHLTADIDVVKHKDAPLGGVRRFRLVEHVVDIDSMPCATEDERSTLVAVPWDGAAVVASDARDTETMIVDLLRDAAPSEGLTAAEIAVGTSLHKVTVHRALKRLDGRITTIEGRRGTSSRYRP